MWPTFWHQGSQFLNESDLMHNPAALTAGSRARGSQQHIVAQQESEAVDNPCAPSEKNNTSGRKHKARDSQRYRRMLFLVDSKLSPKSVAP